jgi:hypothetical protein
MSTGPSLQFEGHQGSRPCPRGAGAAGLSLGKRRHQSRRSGCRLTRAARRQSRPTGRLFLLLSRSWHVECGRAHHLRVELMVLSRRGMAVDNVRKAIGPAFPRGSARAPSQQRKLHPIGRLGQSGRMRTRHHVPGGTRTGLPVKWQSWCDQPGSAPPNAEGL